MICQAIAFSSGVMALAIRWDGDTIVEGCPITMDRDDGKER